MKWISDLPDTIIADGWLGKEGSEAEGTQVAVREIALHSHSMYVKEAWRT